MFGRRETAELSLRQVEAENIKRNQKVLLLGLREKEMTTRVLSLGQLPPAEMMQAPRELTSALLLTLGDCVSTLITGKVLSLLWRWRSLAKKTYKDTNMQYQLRHRKKSMFLI